MIGGADRIGHHASHKHGNLWLKLKGYFSLGWVQRIDAVLPQAPANFVAS